MKGMVPVCFTGGLGLQGFSPFAQGELEPYAPPKEGQTVDMTPWAYAYHKGSLTNPSETEWLWPKKFLKMETVNGSMTWSYLDSLERFPKESVLCGFLWEEPRDVNRVTVEFPKAQGAAPNAGEIAVACQPVDSMWEDCKPWTWDTRPVMLASEGEPNTTPQGTTVFNFSSKVERITKLYVIYNGSNTNIGLPTVRAYGAAQWKKPVTVEVEWGFAKDKTDLRWDGSVEAYNGIVEAVEPLENGNGLRTLGKQHWREEVGARGRKGIKLRLLSTSGPANTRTVVTLWTTGGNFSFAERDLDEGPILIPSLGVFIAREGSGSTAWQFQEQIARSGKTTIRQRVREHAEQSLDNAMSEILGNRVLPDFPVPPFETPMKIDVPEKLINNQWRLGAWHLKRWSQKLDDGTYCVSIWPFDKGGPHDGNEGMAAIGAETYQILRTLDLIGLSDVAEGGLNYWIFGKHAIPFVWFAEVMGDDALVDPFNSPNHHSPGYDQKHTGGHGQILHTAAFHYRLTGDRAWLQKATPALEKACNATIRVRKEWTKHLSKEAWGYGLIPPGNVSDLGDTRLYFYLSLCWYSGLKAAARVLSDGHASSLVEEAERFRLDFRKAVDRSAALTPVVKVRDGTYRRYVPWQPYLRGTGIELQVGAAGRYLNAVMGGLRLVPDIYDQQESVVQEMLDVYEDTFLSRDVEESPSGEAWFTRGGYGPQCGHETIQQLQLLMDDIPFYLRGVFNGYAAEVDPDKGYIFWEGPFKAGAADKTFEEAAFLERVRMMLVVEYGDALWLARATPRAWLEQGKKIRVSNSPTFFGIVAYEIVSDVDNGKITATVEMPLRNAPQTVFLRFRHPKAAAMMSVEVNGKPWKHFDREKEVIRLEGLSGTVAVTARYF